MWPAMLEGPGKLTRHAGPGGLALHVTATWGVLPDLTPPGGEC